MGEKKAIPLRSIFLAASAVVFMAADFGLSFQVTPNGWCAGFLLTASLWFMLVGAFIGMQTQPDGGQPPVPVVLSAVILEGAKTTLLAFLVYSSSGRYVLLSGFSLLLAFLTSIVTLALAALVGDSLSKSKAREFQRPISTILLRLEPIVTWLRTRHVSALCCAFASFLLCASYLTFAVAFDDKHEPRGSLYSPIPKSALPASASDHNDHNEYVCFYFENNSSDLTNSFELWKSELCETPPAERASKTAMDTDRFASLVETKKPEWKGARQKVAVRNIVALCAAQRWFKETTKGQLRLTILGHASEPARNLDVSLDSRRLEDLANAELARGRAQSTFVVLDRLAERLETEARIAKAQTNLPERLAWQVLACGSERTTLDPEAAHPDSGLDIQMSAEVKRQIPDGSSSKKESDLDLLDYTYFMIYTITTTGYGDLMPTTATTKFAVSLANLIEVIYLPIIFLLITTKRDALPGSPPETEDPLSTEDAPNTTTTAPADPNMSKALSTD